MNSGKKSLLSQLFGKLDVDKYGALEDSLYADGGAYESFDIPYENYEGNNVSKSQSTLGEGNRFYSPYSMKRHPFTKKPQHMTPVSKLGQPDLVSL